MHFIQFDKIFKSWERFYQLNTKPILTTTEKPTSTNLAIYVGDCTFANCVSTDSGGVLSYTKTGSLLVEFSTFTECSATNYGGSIYAKSCNCIITCICSFKCFVKNGIGQFLYNDLQDDDKLNYVYQSSVCSTEDVSGAWAPINCRYGKQKCETVNISNNYVTGESSAFNFEYPSITNVNYCSFTHNHAKNWIALRFELGDSLGVINRCNIIRNTQEGDNWATISCLSMSIEFTECIILENSQTPLFISTGTGQSITVSNCVLQTGYTTVGILNTLSPTNSLDLDFESFIEDCSLLVRARCSHNCCQCLSNIFGFLQNLFVFEVSIPILQF